MDTDTDSGDALVDLDNIASLLEEELNHIDRVTFIYGRNYYFGKGSPGNPHGGEKK